jgi:hypothetical protein
MSRDHVEFLQSQQLEWQPAPCSHLQGGEAKLLSQDSASGAATLLLRLPSGWDSSAYGHLEAADEFLVLEGDLQLNERVFRQDCYACLPAGTVRTRMRSERGALLIVFFDGAPSWQAGVTAPGRFPRQDGVAFLDAFEMAWEYSGMDPVYGQQGLRWKLLRGGPGEAQMTMLVSAPPHQHPPHWRGAQERHACIEEMFLISGDCLSNVGIMRPGAYFWRPAGIAHGPYGSRGGSYAIIRTIGARLENNWTEHEVEISRDQPCSAHVPALRGLQSPAAWHPPTY